MSLLAKALLIVMMNKNDGNATIGSESVSITESVTECRQSQLVFMRSKSNVIDVVSNGNRLTFTQVTPALQGNIKYKLDCVELEGMQ